MLPITTNGIEYAELLPTTTSKSPQPPCLIPQKFLETRNGSAGLNEIAKLAQQVLSIIILMPHLSLIYIGIDHNCYKITRDEYRNDVLGMNFSDYVSERMWEGDLEPSESNSSDGSPRLTPALPQPLAPPSSDNELYILGLRGPRSFEAYH